MEQILGGECCIITKRIALRVVVQVRTVKQYDQSSLCVSAHSW